MSTIRGTKVDQYLYRLLAMCGCQLVLEASPWLLFPSFFEPLNWEKTSLAASKLGYAFVHAAALVLIETLLVAAMLSALKGGRKHRQRALRFTSTLLLVLLGGPLTFYYTLLLSSWFYYCSRAAFLHFSDLYLLTYLGDPLTLINTVAIKDLFNAMGALSLGFLVFLLMFTLAPLSPAKDNLLAHSFALIGMIFFCSIRTDASAKDDRAYKDFFANYVSPRAAWYGSVMDGSHQEDGNVFSPDQFTSSYGLEDYRKQVTPNWTHKQNIVLIVVEALRRDTMAEFGGDERITPTLNALAENGISFPQAYAVAPDTGYSQSILITGLHPLKFPTRDLLLDLDYPFFRIYDLLSEVGYSTAYFTSEWMLSQRLSHSPKLGLLSDPELEHHAEGASVRKQNSTGILSLSAIDEINVSRFCDWVDSQTTQPFFSILYLLSSHAPYETPPGAEKIFGDTEMAVPPSVFNVDPKDIPVYKRRYWTTIRYIDRLIGRIVEHLHSRGLSDSTTLIITGDHGEAFGEHGFTGHPAPLYQELLAVPLVISPAAATSRADLESTPVSHLDVAPTILKLAQLPLTKAFQGRALLDEKGAQVPLPAAPLYLTVQMLTQEDAIILFPFKFIYNVRSGRTQLFNIASDPLEQQDLSGRAGSIEEELKLRLSRFRGQQLQYYALPRTIRQRFFPPALP